MTRNGDECLDHIDDILEALDKIKRFTEGMTREEFRDDEKTVDAVLRNFEVVGEATKNIPDEIRQQHDEIPWTEMAGMRDKLIHGYATVDLDIVWTTVEEDLPQLRPKLGSVRDDLRKE